jgi:SAM-dependent methyltransferase
VNGSEAPLHIPRHGNLSAGDILQEMHEQARYASSRNVQGAPMAQADALKEADLPTLLSGHGTAFVDNAFIAILHRSPDPKGLTNCASQLATGARGKIEILGMLRYSPEGRKIGVKIPGLLSRYILVRSSRLRGIGRFVGLLLRLVRWRREARRLLNSIAMLRSTTKGLQDAVVNFGHRLERLEADVASPQPNARLDEIETQLAALAMDSWAEPLVALAAQMDESSQRMRLLELQSGDIGTIAAMLRGLRAEHGWPEEDASSFATRLTSVSRDVVRRATQAEETAQRNRIELLDQSRRLGLLLADVRRRLDQPFVSEEAVRLEEADDHRLDSLYVAFEDRFRGSRSDIRERQRAHLPLLHDGLAGSEDRPIVDIGAGRGEWLELLREERLQATGVDVNDGMVKLCTSLGLNCVQDDALGYLRRLADNSLGAVTGFHIIEHLHFKTFVALLDESRRVLKPGGLILFETPNPANLLVGSRWFYLDPTHRNPMPAEMTAMIAEARGFVQVDIHELHPMPARFSARDEVLAAQLDRIFYGPQDYAIVARKA